MSDQQYFSLLQFLVLMSSILLFPISDQSFLAYFGICLEGVESGKLIGMVTNSYTCSMVQNLSIYIIDIKNQKVVCNFYGLQFFQCNINFHLMGKSFLNINNTSNGDLKILPLHGFDSLENCYCSQGIEVIQLEGSDVFKLKLDPFNFIYSKIPSTASVFLKGKQSDSYKFLMNMSVKAYLVPDSLWNSKERIITYIEIPSEELCFFKPVDFLFIISGRENCSQLLVLENYSLISEEDFLLRHHCVFNMSDKMIRYSFPGQFSGKLIRLDVYMDDDLSETRIPSEKERDSGKGNIFSPGKFRDIVPVITFQYCELLEYRVNTSCLVIEKELYLDGNDIVKNDGFHSRTFWFVLGVCLFILVVIIIFCSFCFLRLRLRTNNNAHEYVEEEMLRMVPSLETT